MEDESLQQYALQGIQETGEELGRGSYAVVYTVKYKGLTCAAKKLHEQLYQQGLGYAARRFQEECALLSQLRHPNIVQFLGVYHQPGYTLPALVMEYLPLTLAQCLDEYGVLPNEISYSLLKDVALALSYLHQHTPPVIHRDLSANNVLLTIGMTAKISDLGVARILDLSKSRMRTMTQTPGTMCYMPPEALEPDARYNSKVDVFSYGVLMVHVFSGEWPFPTKAVKVDPNDDSRMIPQSEADRRQVQLDTIGMHNPQMNLILLCLHNSPTRRPEADDILTQVSRVAEQYPSSSGNKVELLQQLVSLREGTERLQHTLQAKELEIMSLNADKERFQQSLQAKEVEIVTLSADKERFQQSLQAREAENRLLLTDKERLQHTVAEQQIDIKKLQDDANISQTEHETEIRSMRIEMDRLKQTLQRKEEELSSLRECSKNSQLQEAETSLLKPETETAQQRVETTVKSHEAVLKLNAEADLKLDAEAAQHGMETAIDSHVSTSVPVALKPYRVDRYINSKSNVRLYYAYGNTVPDDLLEHVDSNTEPSVLMLGCGDIRSVFYTLWKNFDPLVSQQRFHTVSFLLNDDSAAVLARNILFLYLVLRMPDGQGEERLQWISTVWAIWYSHELLPYHKRVLNEALKKLTEWSSSQHVWQQAPQNPLKDLVKFMTDGTIFNIHNTWKKWSKEKYISLGALLSRQRESLQKYFPKHKRHAMASWHVPNFLGAFNLETPASEKAKLIEEYTAYFNSGSSLLESLHKDYVNVTKNFANPTFIEQDNKKYTLNFAANPFDCFFQSVSFIPKALKKDSGVHKEVISQMIVSDEEFEQYPLLANSVQQFSLWLTSSAAVLKSTPVSFMVHQCDAIQFCQELHCNSRIYQKSANCLTKFNVIHTSDLIDSLSSTSLVLTAVRLLLEHGILLTTSLLYYSNADDAEKYLKSLTGLPVDLLPVVCGVRCISQEGCYADKTCIQPAPLDQTRFREDGERFVRRQKLLLWKKVSTAPFVLEHLEQSNVVTQALFSNIKASSCSRLETSRVMCVESSLLVLRTFVSQLHPEVKMGDYHFWDDLCSMVLRDRCMKEIVAHLQTQALLHGIHLHLTVCPSDCPICTGSPVKEYASQILFPCTTNDVGLGGSTSTYFSIAIHKDPEFNEQKEFHVFDSADACVSADGNVTLNVYIPNSFIERGYWATVMTVGSVGVPVLRRSLSALKHCKTEYYFEQPVQNLPTIFSFQCAVTFHFAVDSNTFDSSVCFDISDGNERFPKYEKLSATALKLTMGYKHLTLTYPYPVGDPVGDPVFAQMTRSCDRIEYAIIVKRDTYSVMEEKPMFLVNPDNHLVLTTCKPLPMEALNNCLDLQFTVQEKCYQKGHEHSLTQPSVDLVKTKEAIGRLFLAQKRMVHLLERTTSSLLAVVIINHKLFDVQNMTAAIDVSYVLADFPIPVANHLASHDQDAERVDITRIVFNKLTVFLQRFSQCTIVGKQMSGLPYLSGSGVEQYFTRAVVYPLYPDPDKLIYDFKHSANRFLSASKFETCENCGIKRRTLLKCSACRRSCYCSKECQIQNWPNHKKDCLSARKQK